MELIHFSKDEMIDMKLKYKQSGDRGFLKPVGLWVSDESDFGWSRWCRGEEFHVEALANAHLVTLKPNANILLLKTVGEIDSFTEKYSISMFPGVDLKTIDWKRVASEYQGLVITPYQWERRLDPDSHWYYSWDVASGCIWDTDCIESITLLPDYQLPPME